MRLVFPPDGHPHYPPPYSPAVDGTPVLQAIVVWFTCALIGGSLVWTALALVFDIKV